MCMLCCCVCVWVCAVLCCLCLYLFSILKEGRRAIEHNFLPLKCVYPFIERKMGVNLSTHFLPPSLPPLPPLPPSLPPSSLPLSSPPSSLPYRLSNGAEYLFIARDEADLVGWVEAINRAMQTQRSTNPLSASAHFRKTVIYSVGEVLKYRALTSFLCPPTSVRLNTLGLLFFTGTNFTGF